MCCCKCSHEDSITSGDDIVNDVSDNLTLADSNSREVMNKKPKIEYSKEESRTPLTESNGTSDEDSDNIQESGENGHTKHGFRHLSTKHKKIWPSESIEDSKNPAKSDAVMQSSEVTHSDRLKSKTGITKTTNKVRLPTNSEINRKKYAHSLDKENNNNRNDVINIKEKEIM